MEETDGMNDCDKAARMIQCCNEKSPDVVNGVILALNKSISSEMLARKFKKNSQTNDQSFSNRLHHCSPAHLA